MELVYKQYTSKEDTLNFIQYFPRFWQASFFRLICKVVVIMLTDFFFIKLVNSGHSILEACYISNLVPICIFIGQVKTAFVSLKCVNNTCRVQTGLCKIPTCLLTLKTDFCINAIASINHGHCQTSIQYIQTWSGKWCT